MAWSWTDSSGVVHTTPVCYIDAAGVHRPALSDCLNYFIEGYQSIYGSDVYLGADSQDGELLGLLSSICDDTNAQCVSAYNGFSPATAQGNGLSSIVKMNGLAREVPSYSTVPVLVVGVALTPLPATQITDAAGNVWAFPATTIPASGQVTVTATCTVLGAITVPLATAFTIKTQTRGLQSITSDAAVAASPGQPVELDPHLRIRQSQSTMGPSQSVLEGIVGQILALPGVTACQAYENDTAFSDANGLPGGSIALVITGGTPSQIAQVIGLNKAPGVNTYGTTSADYVDAYGISHQINWFVPNLVPVYFSIRLIAGSGYTTDVGSDIANALAAWVNGLGTGNNLSVNRANVPANLSGSAESLTYEILSLQVARANSAASTKDIVAKFTDCFTCQAGAPVITGANGNVTTYGNIVITTVLS